LITHDVVVGVVVVVVVGVVVVVVGVVVVEVLKSNLDPNS
jgi:hypothetical protein